MIEKVVLEKLYMNDELSMMQIAQILDCSPHKIEYLIDELKEDPSKFGKVTVSQSGSIGTYKHKNETGVLILNFHNYKLRDIIVKSCRDSSVGRAHPW